MASSPVCSAMLTTGDIASRCIMLHLAFRRFDMTGQHSNGNAERTAPRHWRQLLPKLRQFESDTTLRGCVRVLFDDSDIRFPPERVVFATPQLPARRKYIV